MDCYGADRVLAPPVRNVARIYPTHRTLDCRVRRYLRHLSSGLRTSWRLLYVTAIATFPIAAEAQVSTDLEHAPTLTIERYSEDWSELADPANRTGHWTERLKFIPLNSDGSTYLTTGLEARSRYEGYQNVNWGSAPDDGYV